MNATDIKPIAIANKTESQLNDPGISYNQAGYSYNQAGVTYGGVYGAIENIKIVAKATDVKPT